MSEVDEFLGEVGGVDEQDEFKADPNPFLDDTTSLQEEVTEEKPLPFHKDPKVQRYVEKEISKALKNVRPEREIIREVGVPTAQSENELVAAFTQIIGNDTPEKQHALRMLEKGLSETEEKAAARIRAELQQQAEEAQRAEAEASAELDAYFDEIEERFDTDLTSNSPQARKERAEFVEFIRKVSPKNAAGEVTEFPDLVEVYDVFKATRKSPSADNKKQLASRSMTRSGDASTEKVQKDNSWAGVERYFSKLKG